MKLRGQIVNMFVLSIFMLGSLLGDMALARHAGKDCERPPVARILRDPGDAFPWGFELPFPWRGIQGIWMTEMGGKPVYFSFKTVKAGSFGNQLRIIEYNPVNCNIIARGGGFEEDRVVTAIMNGVDGTFTMTVHVFRESDMSLARQMRPVSKMENPNDKTVTVLKMNSSDGVSPEVAYELAKVSTDINSVCRPSY